MENLFVNFFTSILDLITSFFAMTEAWLSNIFS